MRAALLLILLAAASHSALAQEAAVRASESPHYVGVPIDIEVTADGFARSPEPTIEVETPAGAVLELVAVNPNFSTSIQIINGRMTQSETIRFVYRYRLIAERPGTLELGPFRMVQGTSSALTGDVRFEIQEVPKSSEQRFRLVLPEGPIWVGQRVPIRIEWWLSESFAERLAGRRARVPLFDAVDRFSFEDPELTGARSMLTVDTAAGPLDLPMTVERAQWQGESYLVVSAQRSLIPLRPGTVTVEPAYVVVEETTRWSTDFFGNRVPAGVRRLRVEDRVRELEVSAPPTAGRPASFSGAVGTGFSIDVSADRSVVQTGDPIRLTIELRGDAALETVSLPRLAVSGLAPEDFKIPEGPVAGVVEGAVKRFEVVLRVKNDDVREIPPIELSWFDADLGAYQTTRSRPIALSVRPATVVTATDVVRSEPEADAAIDGATRSRNPDADSDRAAPAAGRPAFSVSGAELAIETSLDALQEAAVPAYAGRLGQAAMYACGFALLGAALWARRRASLDPELRSRRQALAEARRAVAQAPEVDDLARVLRRMGTLSPGVRREEYERILVECDNVAYAPRSGTDRSIDPPLRARALAVADAMLEAAQ